MQQITNHTLKKLKNDWRTAELFNHSSENANSETGMHTKTACVMFFLLCDPPYTWNAASFQKKFFTGMSNEWYACLNNTDKLHTVHNAWQWLADVMSIKEKLLHAEHKHPLIMNTMKGIQRRWMKWNWTFMPASIKILSEWVSIWLSHAP